MKMNYSAISAFPFQTAMQKLSAAPLDGHSAYKIKRINAELKAARTKISEEYKKEIVEVFAKRDTEGKYDEEKFEPADGKEDEFEKAQETFGEKEFELDIQKLPFSILSNLKVSANDLEALTPVVDDAGADAPPIPKGTVNLKRA